MFTDENTTGFSTEELEEMNNELDQRLNSEEMGGFLPGSYEWTDRKQNIEESIVYKYSVRE